MKKVILFIVFLALMSIVILPGYTVADSPVNSSTQPSTKPWDGGTISRHGPDGDYTFDMLYDRYELGENVTAKLSYRNTTKEMQEFPYRTSLIWLTFFDLTLDGKPVPLTARGLMQRQAKPHVQRLLEPGPLIVMPNGEITIEFDLNQFYDLTLSGIYTLTPKAPEGKDEKNWELSKPITIQIRLSYERESWHLKDVR